MYKFINFVLFFIYNISCKSTTNLLYYNEYRFRVCGAYCGPGWCNNKWLDENKCNTSVEPEYHNLTGYSCADICCRHHDKCCGHDKDLKYNCNTEIVKCLSNCNPASLTCTIYDLPILPSEIELGMHIVEDWCCGEPCPKL